MKVALLQLYRCAIVIWIYMQSADICTVYCILYSCTCRDIYFPFYHPPPPPKKYIFSTQSVGYLHGGKPGKISFWIGGGGII